MRVYRLLWMGRGRHTVSYHDGIKRHADGSPFFDFAVCKTERAQRKLVNELRRQGYTPQG